MSKSLGNGALVSEVIKRFPARAVRFYLAQPHYRSTIEYSDDLARRGRGRAGPDRQLRRPGDRAGRPRADAGRAGRLRHRDERRSRHAGAVAVLHDAVRDGNSALDAGDQDRARAPAGEVTGMLMILGLNAGQPDLAPPALTSS